MCRWRQRPPEYALSSPSEHDHGPRSPYRPSRALFDVGSIPNRETPSIEIGRMLSGQIGVRALCVPVAHGVDPSGWRRASATASTRPSRLRFERRSWTLATTPTRRGAAGHSSSFRMRMMPAPVREGMASRCSFPWPTACFGSSATPRSPRVLNLHLHPKQLLALKTRATEVL
jgi:hypothetical protein